MLYESVSKSAVEIYLLQVLPFCNQTAEIKPAAKVRHLIEYFRTEEILVRLHV